MACVESSFDADRSSTCAGGLPPDDSLRVDTVRPGACSKVAGNVTPPAEVFFEDLLIGLHDVHPLPNLIRQREAQVFTSDYDSSRFDPRILICDEDFPPLIADAIRSCKPGLPRSHIHYSFNMHKMNDEGEDADPVLLANEHGGVIAVFDGLGGAGSTVYSLSGTRRTGAFIASRLAAEIFEKHVITQRDEHGFYFPNEKMLKRDLLGTFKARIAELDATSTRPTALRGSLLKRLPTTFASLSFDVQLDGLIRCQALWAGDSRCYVLSPEKGMQLASIDDLSSSGDAFDNLISDSPLSNFVNADSSFRLNLNEFSLTAPIVLITASDGCFGYLLSPAHFEDMILDCMFKARDEIEWPRLIRERLASASDDCSMAVICVGWRSFWELQGSFHDRRRMVQREYIERMNQLRQDIEQLEEKVRIASTLRTQLSGEYAMLRETLWARYKPDHEQFISSRANSVGAPTLEHQGARSREPSKEG
jgi:serine/threonine protein phosphatase PrpC